MYTHAYQKILLVLLVSAIIANDIDCMHNHVQVSGQSESINNLSEVARRGNNGSI